MAVAVSKQTLFLLIPVIFTASVAILWFVLPCESVAAGSYACLGSEQLGGLMFLLMLLAGFIMWPIAFICLATLGVQFLIGFIRKKRS